MILQVQRGMALAIVRDNALAQDGTSRTRYPLKIISDSNLPLYIRMMLASRDAPLVGDNKAWTYCLLEKTISKSIYLLFVRLTFNLLTDIFHHNPFKFI